MNLRALLSLCFVLATAACGGPLDPQPPGTGGGSGSGPLDFLGANNSAVLSGVTLGKPNSTNAELQRRITVTVREPSTTLSALDGFIFRREQFAPDLTVAVRVKNVGKQPLCFIRARDLHLEDSGVRLHTNAWAFVMGSVGVISLVVVQSCLAPAEVGLIAYEISAFSGEFDGPNELLLSWEEPVTTGIETLAGKVIPTDYALQRIDDLTDYVLIGFTNRGASGAKVSKVPATVIGLNARGEPTEVLSASSDLYPASGRLQSGAKGSVLAHVRTHNQFQKLWVFMDYTECAECGP